jgi:hypothetical protein
VDEVRYKPVLQRLNKCLLYPSSIAFYGYGAVSSIGKFKKSHVFSSDPSVQAYRESRIFGGDPSARTYRAYVDEITRVNPSIPRTIFKPGESDELRGENIGIKVTIHEDPTHKWHIDHTMFVPGVPGSTFCHDRYNEKGDKATLDELSTKMYGKPWEGLTPTQMGTVFKKFIQAEGCETLEEWVEKRRRDEVDSIIKRIGEKKAGKV